MAVSTRSPDHNPVTSDQRVRPRNGNERSAFLSLPPEVRVEILLYYFRANTIHIFERDGPKPSYWWPRFERIGSLDHRICVAADVNLTRSQAENDAHEIRFADNRLYQRRHQACRINHYDDLPQGQGSDLRRLGADTKNISLCFVNKQMYLEAQEVLWNTQAFSFVRVDTFETFCARMTRHQKYNLRKLELSTKVMLKKGSDGEISCEQDWLICENTLQALSGLTDLKLHIQHAMTSRGPSFQMWHHEAANALHMALRKQYGGFRSLQTLKSAEVHVEDLKDLGREHVTAYLPAIEGQFKAELLSPSGEEFITAERQAKSAEQAWLKETEEQYRLLDQNSMHKVNLTHALDSLQEELNRKEAGIADIAKEIGKRKLYSRGPDEELFRRLCRNQEACQQHEVRMQELEARLQIVVTIESDVIDDKISQLEEKISDSRNAQYQYLRKFD